MLVGTFEIITRGIAQVQCKNGQYANMIIIRTARRTIPVLVIPEIFEFEPQDKEIPPFSLDLLELGERYYMELQRVKLESIKGAYALIRIDI